MLRLWRVDRAISRQRRPLVALDLPFLWVATMSVLSHRYAQLAKAADPHVARVAAAQLSRLDRWRGSVATNGSAARSHWWHVPIAALLSEVGNTIIERSNGTFVSGHEPVHGSKSGKCLAVWPSEGRWWCSSCRRGGDAIALAVSLHDWSYHRARVYVGERFGFPPRTEASRG